MLEMSTISYFESIYHRCGHGYCQVGRHGTLSLLKRQNVSVGDAGDSILMSFGFDDDELTFGSSITCSVRLYYSDVDSLHCKIVFDPFKVNAFLECWFPFLTPSL